MDCRLLSGRPAAVDALIASKTVSPGQLPECPDHLLAKPTRSNREPPGPWHEVLFGRRERDGESRLPLPEELAHVSTILPGTLGFDY
jgi:hypothetical protein